PAAPPMMTTFFPIGHFLLFPDLRPAFGPARANGPGLEAQRLTSCPGLQVEVEPRARDHHGQAEDLADRDQPKVQADVRVGLPDVLDEETDGAVAYQVVGQERALEGAFPAHAPEDRKEEQSLEKGLVEL